MKRIIQIFLFFFLLLLIFSFYNKYFTKKNVVKDKIKIDIPSNKLIKTKEDNLIKNLKYDVNIGSTHSYIIESKFSELINVNNVELVKMYEVSAELIDQKKLPLTITSKEAIYNSFDNNTVFYGNIKIKYEDNTIFSNKLEIDFKNNEIKISENVTFVSLNGSVKSDVIKFDMISKKIDIYMDKKNSYVELLGNK